MDSWTTGPGSPTYGHVAECNQREGCLECPYKQICSWYSARDDQIWKMELGRFSFFDKGTRTTATRQVPPRQQPPATTATATTATRDNCHRDYCHRDNCHPRLLPPNVK
ncbi:hypothetical protein DdX_19706 [Ditylenchus destructor]|uniref:Uncharacterized protein n=1 Tax=Ditylenchus destructor TaxID=166010 RepID=A0AAD4MHZ3_9BILA|nr:hypothetical protein DdX_19706 [Ditylenchus destructor]